MFPETGAVGTSDGWFYQDENGWTVCAVERGDVVEVRWDDYTDTWVEVN